MGAARGKRSFKLTLEYDGSGYHGWQRQQGVLTIQEVIESRLEIMLQGPVRIRGSGRTDAGVHARGQVASFHARTRLEPGDILRGLNGLLPPDIVALDVEEVDRSFHAGFSALSKMYEYRILNRPLPSALERQFVWHVRKPLDKRPMSRCLEIIRGRHDFAAFMAAGSSVKTTQRCIHRAHLESLEDGKLRFIFEADGFLRHMVRNLVGTMVEVGMGKRTVEMFRSILAGRDRRQAGVTAPARGLYLVRVRYEDSPGGADSA